MQTRNSNLSVCGSGTIAIDNANIGAKFINATPKYLNITNDTFIAGETVDTTGIYIAGAYINAPKNYKQSHVLRGKTFINGPLQIGGSTIGSLNSSITTLSDGAQIFEDVQITHNMLKFSSNNNGKQDSTSRYIQFNDTSVVFYNNGKTATLPLS